MKNCLLKTSAETSLMVLFAVLRQTREMRRILKREDRRHLLFKSWCYQLYS